MNIDYDHVPTADEVADALDGAADQLLMKGWGQGHLEHDVSGELCVLGGIARHLDLELRFNGHRMLTYPDACPTGKAAVEALIANGCATAHPWTTLRAANVSSWNDRPERTEDDVHDALRSTAKKLRDGELLVTP